MSDKEKIVNIGLVLTAFLFLGTSLHLTYKKDALPASAINVQTVKYTPLTNEQRQVLQNIDYNKASQAKDALQKDLIKSIAQKFLNGGLPSCMGGGSFGSIKVPHSICLPPGPGPYTGQPKLPGQDMKPCPVSGVQGGSVVAVCMAGCCRQVSATGAGEATKGLPQGFGGMLGQTLGQILGKLMSGGDSGGGSSGSYIPPIQRDNYPSIIESTNESYTETLNTDTLAGEDYTDYENYANDETDYFYHEQEDLQTPNAETDIINSDSISTDILSLGAENDKVNEQNEAQKPDYPQRGTAKPKLEPISIQKNSSDYILKTSDNINTNDSRYLVFQNIEKEKINNPELAALRDPEEAIVRKYANKNYDEPAIESEQPQSWWEWLLSFFGL